MVVCYTAVFSVVTQLDLQFGGPDFFFFKSEIIVNRILTVSIVINEICSILKILLLCNV